MLIRAKFLVVSALAIIVCVSCVRAPVKPILPTDFHAFIVDGNHHKTLRDFEAFLRANRITNVVPTEQLLQQGTDWRSHNLPKYAFPPEALWPRMADTLKLLRRFVIPEIGPIQVVSGFRTNDYNSIAGGALRSQHLEFSALDIKPLSDISKEELHTLLNRTWQTHGKGLNMGLGLYNNRRFHIDTGGHRKW